jgi:hypothetical protein
MRFYTKYLLILALLDLSKPAFRIYGDLPPGTYSMIIGELSARKFHEQAWQKKGVTVLVDDMEMLECLVVSTKDNYVEVINWFEQPGQDVGWKTQRILGMVKI